MTAEKIWYADYRYRFEAVRSNGARVTYDTVIRGSSEMETLEKLKDMLGDQVRYDITFLGFDEVAISQWPLLHKLAFGLDKKPVFSTPAVLSHQLALSR